MNTLSNKQDPASIHDGLNAHGISLARDLINTAEKTLICINSAIT